MKTIVGWLSSISALVLLIAAVFGPVAGWWNWPTQLNCSADSAQHLSNLGSWIGGVGGVGLAVLNLIAVGYLGLVWARGRQRVDMSVKLVDQWFSPEMHRHRVDFLKKHAPSGSGGPLGIEGYAVLEFFEKWAALSAANELDARLINRVLGDRAVDWSEYLLKPLWSNVKPGQRDHRILVAIREHVVRF